MEKQFSPIWRKSKASFSCRTAWCSSTISSDFCLWRKSGCSSRLWRGSRSMEFKISEEELLRFSEFVAGTMGLHFPPSRWADLKRGIAAAAGDLGFADIGALPKWLMSAPLTKIQLDALASNLTIGETYFFREKRAFEILASHILPDLIRARQSGERRLRIWSAACCTGEEPYSIAILLSRVIPDWKDWNLTIL